MREKDMINMSGPRTPETSRYSRMGRPILASLSSFWKALLVMSAVTMIVSPPPAIAADEPSAGASAQQPLSQEKLDSLLAPIALYPDQLLTQTLMASTYPLDVVEAARFIKDNRELKGEALDKAVAEKKWDPSVQSLTAFPQVIEMMSDKLDWTQELGNAFLSDEKGVMRTVQTLRQKAEAAGNLKSNEEQKVVTEQSIIIIEPAKPNVVYVPTYNPTVVYGAWWAPAYPPYYWPPPPYYYPPGSMLVAGAIGFGIGMAVSNNHWGWCNAGWHGGSVNINVNNNNVFIKNNQQFNARVNNGTWQHNPSQRKGVAYGDARTRDQYRKTDPNAVSSRRDARGFESGAGTQRPGSGGSSQFSGGAGTRDMQRPSSGGSASQFGGSGTRDTQRAGGGAGASQYGGSAGTRDMQRPSSGGSASQYGGSGTRDTQRTGGGTGASQYGGSAGTRDMQQAGGGNFGQSSAARPSFDAGQSRQQAQSYSNRGASSRATMGGGGGGRSGGGGGRSGGGGGRGR
jgi:hypothetical protein